jgi:hypothetical protein
MIATASAFGDPAKYRMIGKVINRAGIRDAHAERSSYL